MTSSTPYSIGYMLEPSCHYALDKFYETHKRNNKDLPLYVIAHESSRGGFCDNLVLGHDCSNNVSGIYYRSGLYFFDNTYIGC
jgi:hypothetical protein